MARDRQPLEHHNRRAGAAKRERAMRNRKGRRAGTRDHDQLRKGLNRGSNLARYLRKDDDEWRFLRPLRSTDSAMSTATLWERLSAVSRQAMESLSRELSQHSTSAGS